MPFSRRGEELHRARVVACMSVSPGGGRLTKAPVLLRRAREQCGARGRPEDVHAVSSSLICRDRCLHRDEEGFLVH